MTGRNMNLTSNSWLANLTVSEEKKVLKYLLKKYKLAGKGERPVLNSSQPTNVGFGLGLIQLDLDEKNKIFTTSMWSRLMWEDVYLTWNPGDFGGVTTVRMDSRLVWIPDIMLYNTADPEGSARNALVVVNFDGMVTWVPHNIFKSSCSIDVTNFPFDHQQCHMWFGSWTYTVSGINISLLFPSGIDLSTFKADYKDTCEWDISEPQAERRLLPENDTNPIAVLCFTLNLERKLVFSSYILTLPCVFLASLTLVVFCLPPDRPDRTGLAMNLFASFLVLLLILVEAAPPTASSVPLLGVYYCFNMVIIMLSIFLSSMIVNIHRAGESHRKVPKWLRFITLDIIGRLCFVSSFRRKPRMSYHQGIAYQHANINGDDDTTLRHTNQRNHGDEHSVTSPQQPPSNLDAYRNENANNAITTAANSKPGADWLSQVPVDAHLHIAELRKTLDRILILQLQKDAKEAEYRDIVREWKHVAMALDRLFFIFYLVIIVTSLMTLFPRPNWLLNY